ncbi:MAG: helix-turn-helix domain-containing protein [Thomasclavelia sp.]
MKKVELREDEQKKYTTIKKLVETGGNKKKAATKLNCSLRTIDRMIVRYKNQGKAGFVHGNRGKMPSTTISQETKNKIVDLYINEYLNTNYTYFCQIIKIDLVTLLVIQQSIAGLEKKYHFSLRSKKN